MAQKLFNSKTVSGHGPTLGDLIKNKKKDPAEYKDLYEKHGYVFIKEISYINAHIIQLLHKKDRKKVICKVVEINNVITRKDIDEFINKETDVMQGLDHSNIEGFLKFLTDGTQIYQISSYYEAGTLRQLSNKRELSNQPFNFNEAFAIFIQILDGLAYLNSKNLILEYLNMDDIYINNGKLKITNFGNESRKFRLTSLTSNVYLKRIVERHFYNAPEKLKGKDITIKVDTWCLACLIYEICTFDKINEKFQLSKPIELPRLYSRHAVLNDFMIDMMKEKPEERISTVDLLNRIVSYDTFIYPKTDILNENGTERGYEEILDHIDEKILKNEKVKRYDIYISFCDDESKYLQEAIDNLLNYFKNDKQLAVISNDNKRVRDSIQIADDIMSSTMCLVLLTKTYYQSALAKHELTIAKAAIENFTVFELEEFKRDELECAIGSFISTQKIYKAFPYDSDSKFEKQWVWFDNFLKSIKLIEAIRYPTPVPPPEPATGSASQATAVTTTIAKTNGDKFHCFISHKWAGDSPSQFVEEFNKALTTNHNLKVWFDKKQIAYGDNLPVEMQKGIQDSTIVLACIRKGYDESDNCKMEINYALAIKKPIIVVMQDDINIKDLKAPVGIIAASMYRFNVFSWQNLNDIDKKKRINDLVNDFNRFLKYDRK